MTPPVLVRHSPLYDILKRVLDVTLVLVALPVVLLVAVAIMLAIRLDTPGPVVFEQRRTGRDGRRFPMYKFRTMVQDAEERKAEFAHLNVLDPPDFKIPDDPRVTHVGRFLRATSLDELPQLWNVLLGDMSLVGPRPTSFAVETYDLWHCQRLEVRPGVTGLWQLSGRGDTEFDERLRLDITYLRTRSLTKDLQILAATAAAVVRRTGR